MASQSPHDSPDPRTWRPSSKEWFPRLYIGQHYQDISVPVYCYMEQPSSESDALADLKWAIHPLGHPLMNAKSWMSFDMPISTMMYQFTILSNDLRHEFMILLDSALKAKYLSQTKFDDKAPIYSERAKDVNSPIQSVNVNPVSSLNRPVEDTVLKHATKIKREARMERQQARKSWSWHTPRHTSSKASTPGSDDGHVKTKAAETMKIKKSSGEKVPTTNPVLAVPKGLEEDTFSPLIKPSSEPSNLTPHLNSMSVMKRKNEEAHIGQLPPQSRQEPSTPLPAPTGPKKWSYFDNYKKLPPSNAGYPGVQPNPSTGHWKTRYVGPYLQYYE